MDEFHPVLARMRIAALQSEYVLLPAPQPPCGSAFGLGKCVLTRLR